MGKPSQYAASHPGEFSLAIPPWLVAMSISNGKSWEKQAHRTTH